VHRTVHIMIPRRLCRRFCSANAAPRWGPIAYISCTCLLLRLIRSCSSHVSKSALMSWKVLSLRMSRAVIVQETNHVGRHCDGPNVATRTYKYVQEASAVCCFASIAGTNAKAKVSIPVTTAIVTMITLCMMYLRLYHQHSTTVARPWSRSFKRR
jgi:hypothetical protein